MPADKHLLRLPGDHFKRRSVNDLFDRFDMAIDFLGRELQFIKPAFDKRLPAQPENPRFKTGQLKWRRRFEGGNRSTCDKDLLGKSDADGFARAGGTRRPGVPALDRFYRAGLVRRREYQLITDFERTRFDTARQDTSV